jgi:hypothetical protein
MRILELLTVEEGLEERKISNPTKSQCGQKWLSNVRYGQCVSLGYKKHNTHHTDGTGTQGKAGTGKSLNKKVAASEKHGGSVKNYGGDHS